MLIQGLIFRKKIKNNYENIIFLQQIMLFVLVVIMVYKYKEQFPYDI